MHGPGDFSSLENRKVMEKLNENCKYKKGKRKRATNYQKVISFDKIPPPLTFCPDLYFLLFTPYAIPRFRLPVVI
jgi:hypothetical protein